jgi:hypothetical protein
MVDTLFGSAGRGITRARGIRARRGGAGRDVVGRSGSVETQAPAHLVLVHDRVGVPAGDARVVGEPMGSFFAAEERGTRFEPVEPLSEAAAGNDRNACDEASVQIR